MGKTTIQWTQRTWNPVRGCTRISEGCRNCYAERQAARNLPGMKSPTTGEGFAVMTPSGPRWTGKLELIPSVLNSLPKNGAPAVYFVNSMSDLFHEKLSDEEIDRVFAVMELHQRYTFQVLTKRAERMRQWFGEDFTPQPVKIYADTELYVSRRERAIEAAAGRILGVRGTVVLPEWPLLNVWLGVSVEDRSTLHRIDSLRRTPAAVRFVSFEPLLEDLGEVNLEGIDWVIIGGESGGKARSCDLAWIRGLMKRGRKAGCAVFVKQLGAKPLVRVSDRLLMPGGITNRKGADPSEWPSDLRVREFPALQPALVS